MKNEFDMQAELAAFKDPKLARGLIESIARLAPPEATLMEVCGTHTVAIARNGIRNLMPEGTHLASGPGCPVCVTSNHDIDTVIALARVPGVTIATFGDMTRVPGSTSSLLKEQAAGRSIEIVYSPLDALTLAEQYPERQIVFVGVGFETTTPLVAMAIKRAAARRPCELHGVRRAQEHAGRAGGHRQRPAAASWTRSSCPGM